MLSELLTAKQLRAAAAAARELAMECVNGTAPDFAPYDYCNCGNGAVAARSGIFYDTLSGRGADGEAIEDAGGDAGVLVTMAMFQRERAQFGTTKHEAAVFPLLALADELDLAAKAAPKALP